MQDRPLPFRTILPWILGVLLFSLLPYLVGWLAAPEGKQFIGVFVNPDDFSTYLAAMRQGGSGFWLFHFPFSPEPWQPRLMLLPYILWGKLAVLPGATAVVWYHLLRLLAGFVSLSVIWVWVRVVLPGNGRWQLTAWFLIVFGAGIGWLTAILFSGAAKNAALDLFGPEWTVLMSLLHTPHFALGLGLEILLFVCVLQWVQNGRIRWVILGALTGIASGLTYVYHIPVEGLVIGLFLLATAVQRRRIPWRVWLGGAVILLPLTLMLGYYAISANQDPYFAHYARVDHVIPPPTVAALLVGLGFLGVIALFGVRRWVQDGRTWLVPLWIAANLLLLYLPIVQFSGRFALGLIVPVATLAAYGLEKVILPRLQAGDFYGRFSRYTATPEASLRRLFLFLVIPSTILLPLLLARNALDTPDFPLYLSRSEVAAADWLAEQSDSGQLVLAYYPMGNYLPRVFSGKVFLGQLDFTTDLDDKLSDVEQFWREDTSDEWREAFLAEWGIDYIYQGQYENEIKQGDVTPPGKVVFQNDQVIIYQTEIGD